MKICICTTPIRPVPTTWPPFGSMAVIQSLRNIGEKVSFYHIDYHRYNHSQNSEYFASQQFDMVGISSVVSTAYAYTKYLTQLIKKVSPKTIVFVGGNLAASAEVLHRKANADYCVIGDGEIIVQNLAKAIKEKKTSSDDLNKILGITYVDSKNKFRFTGYDHPLPADMIERPDYSILEDDNSINNYIIEKSGYPYNLDEDYNKSSLDKDYSAKSDDVLDSEPRFKNKNEKEKAKMQATVVVAKGCVARCTFCHRFEKGYRVSPLDSIINHMKMLKEKYNVRYINIGDENFGSYKNETIKLVKAMKLLGFQWRAATRVHTVNHDPNVLKTWKENGCVLIGSGIESGSPTMLKVMEKKTSLEQNIEATKAAYKAGITTTMQLVIGMPGETDETIEETIDFLIRTMPYYPDFFRNKVTFQLSINYAQALPGTPLYEYAREHGFIGKDLDSEEAYLIKISDTDAYDSDHYINYTQQPLLKALSWRPKILWRVFREHAKTNLNISLSKLSILLSLLIISINQIFKIRLNSPLKKTFDKLESKVKKGSRTSFNNYFYFQYGLKLLLPWNKLTYPFIVLLVAFKVSKGVSRYIRGTLKTDSRKRSESGTYWFFKLIFDHIYWSLNVFKKINLPKETLRKIVKIKDSDESLLIRQGR